MRAALLALVKSEQLPKINFHKTHRIQHQPPVAREQVCAENGLSSEFGSHFHSNCLIEVRSKAVPFERVAPADFGSHDENFVTLAIHKEKFIPHGSLRDLPPSQETWRGPKRRMRTAPRQTERNSNLWLATGPRL